MAAAEKDVVTAAVEESLKHFEDFVIKPQQLDAVQSIIKENDTLCILPTSFGKSLIYQLLPSVVKQVPHQPTNPLVVIVSPLLSLIADQVKSANSSSLGLRATQLENKSFEGIASGKYNLIFGTPESWLNKKWRDVLSSKVFRENLVCIVVDEVHKVSWGTSLDSEKPFRAAFGELSVLRSICRQGVPILALSATVDVNLTELIMESCNMSKNIKIITSYVDRRNIRLSVVPMKEKSFDALKWIANILIDLKEEAPKTIIYCRTVVLLGWLYEKFLRYLGRNGVSEHDSRKLMGMYHSLTPEENKSSVLSCLTSEKPKRLVMATSSLGCGVNAMNVQYVIHFGPAFELVDYCQQIGRGGRNMETQCHAILYNFSHGRAEISKNMKSYLQSKECLRKALYMPFNKDQVEIQPVVPYHLCCSVCAVSCNCTNQCAGTKMFFESFNEDENVYQKVLIREVSEEMMHKVKEKLFQLHESLCASVAMFSPAPIVSGLPFETIEEILHHLRHIDSVKYIMENTSVIDIRVAENVLLIIHECFCDFTFERSMSALEEDVEKKLVFSDTSSDIVSEDSDSDW